MWNLGLILSDWGSGPGMRWDGGKRGWRTVLGGTTVQIEPLAKKMSLLNGDMLDEWSLLGVESGLRVGGEKGTVYTL